MAEKGWIHKYAFQDDALAADNYGRDAMEDGYLQNAKIEDQTITIGKLAVGALMTGQYGISVYGTGTYG